MQAMAQLVRQRHHIAELVGIVRQDVGMNARYGATAEGTAAFARAEFGIDPFFLEEFANDGPCFRAERLVALLDYLPALVPITRRQIGEQWCIAVIIAKRFDLE